MWKNKRRIKEVDFFNLRASITASSELYGIIWHYMALYGMIWKAEAIAEQIIQFLLDFIYGQI